MPGNGDGAPSSDSSAPVKIQGVMKVAATMLMVVATSSSSQQERLEQEETSSSKENRKGSSALSSKVREDKVGPGALRTPPPPTSRRQQKTQKATKENRTIAVDKRIMYSPTLSVDRAFKRMLSRLCVQGGDEEFGRNYPDVDNRSLKWRGEARRRRGSDVVDGEATPLRKRRRRSS